MAGSLNRVQLLGNLGRDPEIRSTQTGQRIGNFSIATSESWRDKASGERKEKTDWHNIVVFNDGLVEVVEKYLRKGSKVFVEGRLQTRKWTDQQGQDRYSTEVVLQQFGATLILLGSKDSNRAPAAESADEYGQASTGQNALDEEIPF